MWPSMAVLELHISIILVFFTGFTLNFWRFCRCLLYSTASLFRLGVVASRCRESLAAQPITKR